MTIGNADTMAEKNPQRHRMVFTIVQKY